MSIAWKRRLRRFRTLFVHRWHAAQTIGEWFGNDAVGERFEHINHARSLVEYLWRCGPFAEDADGSGRVHVGETRGSGLKDVVAPVAARGRAHLEKAVRYAILFGGEGAGPPGAGPDGGREAGELRRYAAREDGRSRAQAARVGSETEELRRYAAQHPDVRDFAARLVALHRAMLRFYVEMRYVTPAEADGLRQTTVPVLRSLAAARGDLYGETPRELEDALSGELPGDLVTALRGAFARNIYNALACRAQTELFETLARHEKSGRVASEARGRVGRSASTAVALVDGRRRRFVVHDRTLAAMLDSIHEEPPHLVFRWLAAFRMAVSAMITTMPVFIVKNFFRDTLAGFVAGRYAQLPFLGTLSGSIHAVHDLATGRSAAMRDYLLQGGFYSGLVESETDFSPVRGTARRRTLGRGHVKRGWTRLVHVLTRPAWIAEAGTRVAQFRRARAAGATNYQASRAARMVSADFANIGASRGWRLYVHTVPFLNAAIQGFDQLYQIVRPRWRRDPSARKWTPDQARHVGKTLLAGLCLSAGSFFVWRHNVSDDARLRAYQAETDYEKASWITLYDIVGDADVRIPVPFQIGATFIKLPEVAFDLAADVQTLAGAKFVWSLVHGNLAVGYIPAVAQPVVEVSTNRNFFGDEIIPAYMRNWAPEDRYFRRSTPLPYRHVGRWLGVSPLHVQTFARGWTGHLGNAAVVVLDERLWDENANGPKPFPRTARLLTGSYSLQPPKPRTYTRYGNEFYEISDWADDKVRGQSCRSARDSATRAACEANRVTNRVAREASQLRRDGDEVRNSRAMARAEKERRLESLYQQIDDRFKRVLPELRAMRRTWRRAGDT